MTLPELYGAIRAQIEHEDDLCNQRMIWLINLHALLFGAYAFSVSAEAGPRGGAVIDVINAARYGIFMAGILTPIPVLLALVAAKRSIDKLVGCWVHIPEVERLAYPQIIGNYRAKANGFSWQTPGVLLGQTPIFALPLILLLVWVYIAIGAYTIKIFIVFIALSIVCLAIYGARALYVQTKNNN